MQCSLYGKLPTKRDFIALNTPRSVLSTFEPWLQSAISASRTTLAGSWQNAFLNAPIWRFWLGADLCGASVIGAFMPSLDGIGRYFPLTLFARADDNCAIPPPEFNPQDDWFHHAENLLLACLHHDTSFDNVLANLDTLPIPHQDLKTSSHAVEIRPGITFAPAPTQDFADVFQSIRTTDYDRIYASTSFWWTLGGEEFAPMAIAAHRMPDPFLFAAMLNGQFAAQDVAAHDAEHSS
jgi:type VI secretion system protein ImpM